MIDLRYTLRSFGVNIEKASWMFGDNKSVVTSSTIPHSTLSKRWNALSYHKVREAVAGGWLRFCHLPRTENAADIFTKPLPWFTLRQTVEPLLFWKGETSTPSGDQATEGSVASPGLEPPNGMTGRRAEQDTNHDPKRNTGVQSVNALWNNQYATLAKQNED